MNWIFILLFPLLAAGTAGQQPGPQAPAAEASAFPEELLKGESNFNLALLFQGDLRGNVGPCG